MPAFDLKDALRGVARDRLYSTMTILTLALAIGATTAVFSIVNGVLLRPLPYRDADRLVSVREVWREFADHFPSVPVNERHFEYWRTHARTFDALAQYIALPANVTAVERRRRFRSSTPAARCSTRSAFCRCSAGRCAWKTNGRATRMSSS